MNQIKVRYFGAILLILVIIVGGWSLGIAPQLSIAANANQDREKVVTFNSANQLLLTKLRNEYQNITALQNTLDNLRISVPTSSNIAPFISELNLLANNENVTVKAIQFSDPKPYTPPIQTPSASGIQGPPLPLTNLKITTTNFVVIPVQISVTGIYGDVLDFMNSAQLGQRLFLVTTFSTTGATGVQHAKIYPPLAADFSEKVDASIGGYIYVLLG